MNFKSTAAALGVTFLLGAGAAQASVIYATQVDAGRSGVAGAGFEAETPAFNSNRADAGNALGAPDQVGNTSGGFYSLGTGGAAVFGFGENFRNTATIFEVTFGCDGPQNADGSCNFKESVDVYTFDGAYTAFDTTFGVADLTGLGFTLAASVPNGLANTAAGVSVAIGGPFTYLALVDTSPGGTGRDGFDVDSVGVSPVPLPASALLLLAGVGGLGALRRARRKS